MLPTPLSSRKNSEISRLGPRRKAGARTGVLVTLVVIQAITVLFFLGDLIGELMVLGFDAHTSSEAIATVIMIVGIGIGGFEMARITRSGKRAESALKMAAGAFADLLKEKFDVWQLTPSEAEVALLTLKGFGAAQIAGLRGTAQGTVRAQLAGIYTKSDCSGRGQFCSLFIDALLDDPVLPRATPDQPDLRNRHPE